MASGLLFSVGVEWVTTPEQPAVGQQSEFSRNGSNTGAARDGPFEVCGVVS